jgi:hypothetical protein
MLIQNAFLLRLCQRDVFLSCWWDALFIVPSWLSRIRTLKTYIQAILLVGMCLSAPTPATAAVTVSELPSANVRSWRCSFGELGSVTGIVCMSDDVEQLVPIVMIIELTTSPLEPAFCAELAQSVMCRPNTDCKTEYLVNNGL